MEALISPPLQIELLSASTVKNYQQVNRSLSTCLNNPELLPNTIGSNTYQIKSHLYRILEEVHQLVKLAPQDKNLSSEAERQNVVRRKRKSQTLQEIIGEELNREKGNSLVKNEEIQTPRSDGKMSKKRKI